MPAGFALTNLNAAARPLWDGKMTPPAAAGWAVLPILRDAAALPGLALGRPGTTSADTLTASSVAITSNAGTDNEYHAGDTITPTVTFSTAVAGHSSASRAIDVGGVDRSATRTPPLPAPPPPPTPPAAPRHSLPGPIPTAAPTPTPPTPTPAPASAAR